MEAVGLYRSRNLSVALLNAYYKKKSVCIFQQLANIVLRFKYVFLKLKIKFFFVYRLFGRIKNYI